MLIAIDVDDTIAEFSSAFNDYHGEKYSHKFGVQNFHSSAWWTDICKDEKEALNRILEFIDSPLMNELAPVVGAIEAIKQLKENHDLVVVTARPEKIMDLTRQWLDTHFKDMFSEVYSTDFHQGGGDKKTKGDICEEIGADILIDDFTDFARECDGRKTKVLVYDRPWNQKDLSDEMTRVKSWDEVLKYISN